MRLEPLENFLREVLLTYKGLEPCLDKLIDETSNEYKMFLKLSTEAHVGFIEFQLKDKVYWLRRISSIRNTAGYTTFQYQLVDLDSRGEHDDVNIMFRIFTDCWEPKRTVNMNIGSL